MFSMHVYIMILESCFSLSLWHFIFGLKLTHLDVVTRITLSCLNYCRLTLARDLNIEVFRNQQLDQFLRF